VAAYSYDLASQLNRYAWDPLQVQMSLSRAQPKTPGAQPGATLERGQGPNVAEGLAAGKAAPDYDPLSRRNFEADLDLVFHSDGSAGNLHGRDAEVGLLEGE